EPAKGAVLPETKKGDLASGAATPPAVSPEPGSTVEAPAAPSPAPAPAQLAPATRRPSRDEVIATHIHVRSAETPDAGPPGANALGSAVLDATKVYLDVSGARSDQPSQQLLQRLPVDNKFSLTDNQDEADIAIKVTVAAKRPGRIALTALIVDANLKIIWPLT